MRLTILFLLLSLSAYGQTVDQFFAAVGKADTEAMAEHLEADVELCITDNTNFLTKAEALKAIGGFLSQNKPTKVTPMHGGSNAKRDSKYKVAKLDTDQGVFRIFVYLEGGQKIQEVRFDKFD